MTDLSGAWYDQEFVDYFLTGSKSSDSGLEIHIREKGTDLGSVFYIAHERIKWLS